MVRALEQVAGCARHDLSDPEHGAPCRRWWRTRTSRSSRSSTPARLLTDMAAGLMDRGMRCSATSRAAPAAGCRVTSDPPGRQSVSAAISVIVDSSPQAPTAFNTRQPPWNGDGRWRTLQPGLSLTLEYDIDARPHDPSRATGARSIPPAALRHRGCAAATCCSAHRKPGLGRRPRRARASAPPARHVDRITVKLVRSMALRVVFEFNARPRPRGSPRPPIHFRGRRRQRPANACSANSPGTAWANGQRSVGVQSLERRSTERKRFSVSGAAIRAWIPRHRCCSRIRARAGSDHGLEAVRSRISCSLISGRARDTGPEFAGEPVSAHQQSAVEKCFPSTPFRHRHWRRSATGDPPACIEFRPSPAIAWLPRLTPSRPTACTRPSKAMTTAVTGASCEPSRRAASKPGWCRCCDGSLPIGRRRLRAVGLPPVLLCQNKPR